MQIESVAPCEAFSAALDCARNQRGLEVGLLVILKVLFKLELLSTMFTGEISKREL